MVSLSKSNLENWTEAVRILRAGGVVALPTETVYGLAADASQDKAVAKIYKAKGRPSYNPLIAHIFDPADAGKFVQVNELAQTLIDVFWPGSLTLVLPKTSGLISPVASAGLNSLAIRCPKTDWAETFLDLGYRGPIFMPSANRSGHISPSRAQHVLDDLGDKIDMIIDGGDCPAGIESTVLKIEGDRAILLRPGAIPVEAFIPYISDLRFAETASAPIAPGMLKSHYAPRAKVRLNAVRKQAGEAYLAFGPTQIDADFNLSPNGDLTEAARNLYGALRSLDNVEVIAIAPIPTLGLGAAINDRLNRAAADKDR